MSKKQAQHLRKDDEFCTTYGTSYRVRGITRRGWEIVRVSVTVLATGREDHIDFFATAPVTVRNNAFEAVQR
jgi:hypothetical protein